MFLIWISRNHVQYNQKFYSNQLKRHHMNQLYHAVDHSYRKVSSAAAFLQAKLYFRSYTIKAIIYLGSYIWSYKHHLKTFDRIN